MGQAWESIGVKWWYNDRLMATERFSRSERVFTVEMGRATERVYFVTHTPLRKAGDEINAAEFYLMPVEAWNRMKTAGLETDTLGATREMVLVGTINILTKEIPRHPTQTLTPDIGLVVLLGYQEMFDFWNILRTGKESEKSELSEEFLGVFNIATSHFHSFADDYERETGQRFPFMKEGKGFLWMPNTELDYIPLHVTVSSPNILAEEAIRELLGKYYDFEIPDSGRDADPNRTFRKGELRLKSSK